MFVAAGLQFRQLYVWCTATWESLRILIRDRQEMLNLIFAIAYKRC